MPEVVNEYCGPVGQARMLEESAADARAAQAERERRWLKRKREDQRVSWRPAKKFRVSSLRLLRQLDNVVIPGR